MFYSLIVILMWLCEKVSRVYLCHLLDEKRELNVIYKCLPQTHSHNTKPTDKLNSADNFKKIHPSEGPCTPCPSPRLGNSLEESREMLMAETKQKDVI